MAESTEPNDGERRAPVEPGGTAGTPEEADAAAGQRPDWTRRTEVTGAVLAGMATLFSAVAAVVALRVQDRQSSTELDVTRQGQITDRFNTAVDNLGDKADEVRLGGIFALRRIMEDSPRDQPAVVDVLSAYVRTHAPTTGGGKTKRDASGRPAPDVRAAFETVAQRDPDYDHSARVDLRDAHLRFVGVRPDLARPDDGAESNGAMLSHANLSGANLSEASLRRTRLAGTFLVGTQLEGTDLRGANLRDADLRGAKLADADLKGADLRGAQLRAVAPKGDDKGSSGTKAPASEQPAQVSAEQLLEARIDRTTKLPSKLEDNPRLEKRLARAQEH